MSPKHEACKAAAETWFAGYFDTFVRCAQAESPSAEPLLPYFHTPLSIITDGAFIPLETREQLAAVLGGELAHLKRSDYGGSQAFDQEVTVVNERAVLLSVTWSRVNRGGVEFQRSRVSYWIANTNDGWKILSSAVHGA